jgi:acetyl esterase/lipase
MIRRQRWMLWYVLLGLPAAMGAQLRAADVPPHRCTRDVIYGRKAGLALTMDVFQPKEKTNGAALLLLLSGDWMSPEEPFRPEGIAEFLGRGYTVFAVCHGSCPAFPVDEIVPDIHRAVRYVRHHAKEYKVDPNRLAIFGISSGGHLAAHVGVSGGDGPTFPKPDFTGIGRYDPIEVEQSSKVAAFVSVCGPTDLLNYEAEGKSILEFRLPSAIRQKAKDQHITAPFEFRDFNRKSYKFERVRDAEEIKRRLKALSPVSLVSAKSAPGLLIHGEKDENVPVRQAESLAGRLREAGVAVDLVIRKGVGHGVYHGREDDKVIADWLDKRLNLRKSEGK